MRSLEIREKDGVEFLFSPLLVECGFLRHAFSTRRGGVSEGRFGSLNLGVVKGEEPDRVRENRRRFFAAADLSPEKVAEVRQVHGVQVVDAEEVAANGGLSADGIMTGESGVFVAVQSADCVPVLLADPVNRAVAAIHAGRRGTEAGVLESALLRMNARYGSRAEDLIAALGPGISGECYEVGEECIPPFRARYPEWREICVSVGRGKWLLDLPAAVRLQLTAAGVPEEQIGSAPNCTFSESARFFSHRRDGAPTGRLLSAIGIV
ncbi:peptidoglycan editing factor PgeF [Nitrospinota bacterium]